MSLLGNLTVGIVGEMPEFSKAMDDAKKQVNDTGESMNSFGSTVTRVFGGIALAAGSLALGAVFVDGIKGAAEAQDSIAQLDAVIKSTGGAAGVTRESITTMADAFEKTTKFTAEATQASAGLLLTFTNIGKDVFPQATKTTLDMAQALGGDAKNQAILLGKALNDPINGISALTRVGVSFSEEQKNTIKTMVEMGDTAGAQKIILAELQKEFGGSAEAAGKTFSGQLEIVKNSLGNVTEALGVALLPKLTEFLDWINSHMPEIQKGIEEAVGTAVDWFDKAKAAIQFLIDKSNLWLPVLAGLLASITALSVINSVTTAIDAMKKSTLLMTIAQNGLNTALRSNPIGLVVTAIGLLVTAGVLLWKNWDTVKAKAGQLWESMREVFGNVKGFVVGVWSDIKESVKATINSIISGINTLIRGMNRIHFEIPDWVPEVGGKGFGINIPEIPMLAKGTNFFEGGPAIVGERGRELVNLPRGSQVIPNDRTEEMLGSTNYWNVTIPAKDLEEMRTIQDFFGRIQQVARAKG